MKLTFSVRLDRVQSTIENYQSIIDDYHRQTEQIDFLQKEKQQMQRIIDYLANRI